jgi:hypothetical protein
LKAEEGNIKESLRIEKDGSPEEKARNSKRRIGSLVSFGT